MSTCTPFCVKQGRGLKYVTLYSCLCQTGQRSAICPLVHVLLYSCLCQTEQRSAICLFCTPVCVKQAKGLQYVSFVLLSVSYRTKVCNMLPCTPVCVMYHVSVPVCPIVPLYVPNSTMIYIIAIDKRGIQINIFVLFTH